MKKFYDNFVLRSTEDGGENNGGGNTNPNAGEGENDDNEQEYVDPDAENDSAMYEGEEPTINGGYVPVVDVVAPALPPEGEDEEGDGGEGGDETITEPDEEEDNSEGEGDIEEEDVESEDGGGDQGSDDTTVSPETPPRIWDKPEKVPNAFCLIGCCLLAFYRMLGYRPTFDYAKSIADKIAKNSGFGYPARCGYPILETLCKSYGLGLSYWVNVNFTSLAMSYQSYLEHGMQLISTTSTGDQTEHAYLVTRIYPDGGYDCIDTVSGMKMEGNLSEVSQMFLIYRK